MKGTKYLIRNGKLVRKDDVINLDIPRFEPIKECARHILDDFLNNYIKQVKNGEQ